MKRIQSEVVNVKKEISGPLSDSEVLTLLQKNKTNYLDYIIAIKKLSEFSDDVIAECLNMSVRSLQSYRHNETFLKENIKELVVRLLSVVMHGVEVFGTSKEFQIWLNTSNFYFDHKNPISYLKTSAGIKFVDDRLTAMEYGDNV